MSGLAKRTQKLADSFVGQFIVFINDPWGSVFKCLSHSHSGFRLQAIPFGKDQPQHLFRTRKMRLARPEEISNAVAHRINPNEPF